MAVPVSVRLGRRLASLREERGWNQAYLAELAGVGRAHLSQIENGSVAARIDTLEALASGLGITLSALFRNI
jgi:transcriptional regulator with XRE-family HTH domain